MLRTSHCLPSLTCRWTPWPNRPSISWVPVIPQCVVDSIPSGLTHLLRSMSAHSASPQLPISNSLLNPKGFYLHLCHHFGGLASHWLSTSVAPAYLLHVGIQICLQAFGHCEQDVLVEEVGFPTSIQSVARWRSLPSMYSNVHILRELWPGMKGLTAFVHGLLMLILTCR